MAGRGMVFILYVFASLVGVASGAKLVDKASGAKVVDKAGLRSGHSGSEVVATEAARTIVQESAKALSPEQNIIICNAYAHSKPLDILNVHTEQRLTQDGGLAYRSCGSFYTFLQEGDRLEFKAGNASVGIFRATGIPKSRASLLLIPHRRDVNSLTAAFKSHAFAESSSPQIAVVDTYKGKGVSKVKIMDAEAEQEKPMEQPKQTRVEELHFNSVVALGVGKYQVMLQTDDAKDIAKASLQVVADQSNYVVMRTGLENSGNATIAPAFPQELVVYGERRASQSSAAQLRLPMLAAVLAGLAAAVF